VHLFNAGFTGGAISLPNARYKRVIERFTGFLGEPKTKRVLSTLQASDIARFRDREAKELTLDRESQCEGVAGISRV